MKVALILLITIALASSLKVCPYMAWEKFQKEHGKVYGSEEESTARFEIFKTNLELAESLQKFDQGAEYGVTQFMDMSTEEFKKMYLTLKTDNIDNIEMAEPLMFSVEDMPASFDWRDHGAVTPVKNQGQCGSCWAFSTVACLEGQYFLKNKELKSFSEQELVDCDDNGDQGCNGGLMQNAFQWLEKHNFYLESEYPYRGVKGSCKTGLTAEGEVASYAKLGTNEQEIAATLATYGPLSIALNATPMQFYRGGIASPLKILCNPASLDHGVTLVGYGSGQNWLGKTEDYWLIKNSWGETWGEKGYYRLIRGTGACGVNTNVVKAILQ